tara:strand:+ start:416 stop:667 length:252 start_codon:yes stop_codon:yes gene_type:complete
MNKVAPITDSSALKLVKIGNSTGVILPKDLLDRMGVQQGDSLTMVPDGNGLVLRPHDPEFEKQMAVARDVMKRRKKALRELAK